MSIDWPQAHLVITGGSSGIGAAVARAAVERRARVTLVARGAERLAAVADDLRAAVPGARVHVEVADVADRAEVAAAIAGAAERWGPIDVLVCSAGITRPGRFLELDDDVFTAMIDVDYLGTLWPIRAALPAMVERGRGSIVGVCSAAGLVGVYGYSAYGAAKFAVRGLLEALRTEVAPHGVAVSIAYPPDVDTPMLAEEEPFKPAETRAIAGTIKPLAAPRVAEAILAGVERGRAEIYADAATRALARSAGAVPGVLRGEFDRRVRRLADRPPTPD